MPLIQDTKDIAVHGVSDAPFLPSDPFQPPEWHSLTALEVA